MSGKVAVPLIAGAVALGAVYLFTRKDESSKRARKPKREKGEEGEPGTDPLDGKTDDARIKLDSECMEIISKLEGLEPEHDTWLTNRHNQLYAEGMIDPNDLAIQMLKDQSEHCPWDDQSKWTALMKELHTQLLDAVKEWHANMG